MPRFQRYWIPLAELQRNDPYGQDIQPAQPNPIEWVAERWDRLVREMNELPTNTGEVIDTPIEISPEQRVQNSYINQRLRSNSYISQDWSLEYQPYPDSTVYRTSDVMRPTYTQSYTDELANMDRQLLNRIVEWNLEPLCEIILDKLAKREKIKSLSPIMKSFLDSNLIKLNG